MTENAPLTHSPFASETTPPRKNIALSVRTMPLATGRRAPGRWSRRSFATAQITKPRSRMGTTVATTLAAVCPLTVESCPSGCEQASRLLGDTGLQCLDPCLLIGQDWQHRHSYGSVVDARQVALDVVLGELGCDLLDLLGDESRDPA